MGTHHALHPLVTTHKLEHLILVGIHFSQLLPYIMIILNRQSRLSLSWVVLVTMIWRWVIICLVGLFGYPRFLLMVELTLVIVVIEWKPWLSGLLVRCPFPPSKVWVVFPLGVVVSRKWTTLGLDSINLLKVRALTIMVPIIETRSTNFLLWGCGLGSRETSSS